MALLSIRQGKSDLARLHRDMDDLIHSFFGGTPFLTEREVWPLVDISEDADSVTVKAEVPGCKPEDIDISVQGNILSITGEKKHEEEKREKGCYCSERSYGSFRRDLTLPSDVDPSRIDAVCKNGILTINLTKSERAKAVKVKVKGQ